MCRSPSGDNTNRSEAHVKPHLRVRAFVVYIEAPGRGSKGISGTLNSHVLCALQPAGLEGKDCNGGILIGRLGYEYEILEVWHTSVANVQC